MPSVIEGYSYDVFISYRLKDNRHDCWVTSFINHLRAELETTFKEDISIYFDENPVDGLLETHSVDKSLQNKLKCLIFIPVISRTYCDPKSYAWQNELCFFNDFAGKDAYGRDIQLANGNVANRILPVKIHELDHEDEILLEKELGGCLRCIEFIYKTPGVNRPLSPDEDNPRDNLNKTYYRDQINKVANAIKEIVGGMKTGPVPVTSTKKSFVKVKNNGDRQKSIAVMPFVNMSADKEQDYFCDGMAEEIINVIAHNENLKVISRTSAFAFKNTSEDAREIGRKLGVETLLEGSIRKSGNHVRIAVQLIKVDDGSHIWSDRYDREVKDIFEVQDEISEAIFNKLKIKLLDDKKPARLLSENVEAYNLYLRGTYYWQMLTAEGYRIAAECFEQALQKDPNYAQAYIGLSYVTGYSTVWGNICPDKGWPKIRENLQKVMEIDPSSADAVAAIAALNVYYFWNRKEAERNFRLALQINPNASQIHLDYSNFLTFNGRHNEAIAEAKKAQELDPFSVYINTYTGFAFDFAGQYDNAIEEYKRTLEINPGYYITHYHLGRAYLGKRMMPEAIAEFEKSVELSKGTPLTLSFLASAYYIIGRREQCEKILTELIIKSENDYIPATTIFFVHLIRGEHDLAMKWLKKACEQHDTLLPWFKSHPLLEGSPYLKIMTDAGMDY